MCLSLPVMLLLLQLPVERMEEMRHTLQAWAPLGMEVQLHVYENAGYTIPQEELLDVGLFIDKRQM